MKPIVIGNWKLNPTSLSLANTLYTDVQKGVARLRKVEVAVAPPMVFLSALAEKAKGKKTFLVAQDVFWEKLGAHTGEVSNAMLSSINVKHVIIGHSEVREQGETDDEVAKKVSATVKAGNTAIICVGEKERDDHGHYLALVEDQIRMALQGVPKTKLGNVAIAYEPIWAIGTGNTATAHDAHEMKLFIQKVLSDMFGRTALSKIRVLYGGSVNKKNAEELYTQGEVDGFLVGGASLKADNFIEVAKIVDRL
ncbi:triose-phosphate isomerase [Candidatus Kaiserbacteria bacterium]|nr:triose-phosphate isomerase [Candidatus Kaiserbacteria bacterium]